jgi:DtxR family transcriptional regulator, Mn-dependent transcriptional regulator
VWGMAVRGNARGPVRRPILHLFWPASQFACRGSFKNFLAYLIIFLMATEARVRTAAVEDYCKAIYTLESRVDAPVSTNALAERLELTTGSVSGMLKKLGELALIAHVPYRGVRLTPKGRRLALEVIRHHRLLELYLAEALQMPWDRVHAEAEVLEHVLSEELEELIAAKLGHPTIDPHGDPIPSADLELKERPTRSLDSLRPGERGTFVRVSDAEPEMLRYLAGRGIMPGGHLAVIERQPFGGPLLVSVDGTEHTLGGELPRAMRIDLADPAGAPPARSKDAVRAKPTRRVRSTGAVA